MSLNPSDPRPAYIQIADELRRQISSGVLKPGDKLPSLSSLTAKYGHVPMTVRQAVGVLRGEGLVVTRQGQGTFVLDQREATELTPQDWPEYIERLTEAVSDLAERVAALEARLPAETPDGTTRSPRRSTSAKKP